MRGERIILCDIANITKTLSSLYRVSIDMPAPMNGFEVQDLSDCIIFCLFLTKNPFTKSISESDFYLVVVCGEGGADIWC